MLLSVRMPHSGRDEEDYIEAVARTTLTEGKKAGAGDFFIGCDFGLECGGCPVKKERTPTLRKKWDVSSGRHTDNVRKETIVTFQLLETMAQIRNEWTIVFSRVTFEGKTD